MTDVIASGAFDPPGKEGTRFHELSHSRIGSFGDAELARMIVEELKSRDLARDTDGVSVESLSATSPPVPALGRPSRAATEQAVRLS